MAQILRLVNGIPTMIDILTGGVDYDVEEQLGYTLPANTNYTLPSSKTYNTGGFELQVFVDGIGQMVGIDYQEVSSNQIKFPSKTINAGQRIRIRR